MEQAVEVLTITGAPMAKDTVITIQKIPLNKIKLAKNSRVSANKEELDGLMQSIKEVGLLQPIGVVKNGAGFDVCYGSRRFLACSKLGLSHIPAIVHISKKAHDTDIKNLTENIQRRNISLSEAGRYMELLKADNLSISEIATRLGVGRSYVSSCITAYSDVPKEFRDDIEVRLDKSMTGPTAPGKISATVAREIVSAEKSYHLSTTETRAIFSAAKSDDRFEPGSIRKYAAAIKRGKKDFLSAVKPVRNMHVRFFMTEDDCEALEKKFVDDGPFQSLHGLFIAILKGEKSVNLKING